MFHYLSLNILFIFKYILGTDVFHSVVFVITRNLRALGLRYVVCICIPPCMFVAWCLLSENLRVYL
jgi:hypothetical protein